MSRRRRPPERRFHEKWELDEAGCWIWTDFTDRDGYGRFYPERTDQQRAHRWSYEHHVGPIPEGLVIVHLCRTPSCVNPDHLEPVTPAESQRRARKTHCKWGHEFVPENVRIVSSGVRACIQCARRRSREYKRRQREGATAS